MLVINLMFVNFFKLQITKVAPSDTNTLEEFRQRLMYLVDKGCKPYELVEYPEILRLTEADIDKRIERLHSSGQSSISMPLLKFAKPESSDTALRSSLRRYLKQQNGRLNKVDEIRSALQCSDDEMLDILKRNPRLIGTRKRRFIVEKVACLLECGAVIQDIKSNTNLLNNKTLEDIESRAKRLVELGYNDPLPMGVIGRDDDDFEVIVARLAKQRSLHPTSRYLESREIIAKIPDFANRKLHVVKPKVDFLLSRGYVGEEIIEFPSILELGLEAIHDAVIYLQSYHLGAVSLETCHKYATKKRVTSRQSSSRRILAKVLECQSTELPLIPKDLSVVLNTEATLHANYDFLRSIGFTSADLKRLPIVLAHNNEVLRLHWDLIQMEEGLAPHFESWKEDKAKLLQLLQFSIEKESNFSHMAATDVGEERKRVEDLEAETVDYEAHEFTELEEETRKSFEKVQVDATVQGGPGVEQESDEVVSADVEHIEGMEHDIVVERGTDMQHDPGMERDPVRKRDTYMELDSGDMLDADVELDPGVGLYSREEHVLAAEFDPLMELDDDVELDLGAEYDPDVQLEPCMEHDLDLDADSAVELDLSIERDGGVENKQGTESISDASTSSDEELSVGIENDMAKLFPSSSARWTSHDR